MICRVVAKFERGQLHAIMYSLLIFKYGGKTKFQFNMGVTLLCLPSSIPSLTATERESLGEATDEALSSSVHAKFISCHSPSL